MSLLHNLVAFIPEHERELVSIPGALLAGADALGTLGLEFVTLIKSCC